MTPQHDDQYWLDALKSGDEEQHRHARDELWAKYKRDVERWISAACQKYDVARYSRLQTDDIINEVYGKIFGDIDQKEIKSSFGGYLRNAVRNICIKMIFPREKDEWHLEFD